MLNNVPLIHIITVALVIIIDDIGLFAKEGWEKLKDFFF